jgi:hypothetical protein
LQLLEPGRLDLLPRNRRGFHRGVISGSVVVVLVEGISPDLRSVILRRVA